MPQRQNALPLARGPRIPYSPAKTTVFGEEFLEAFLLLPAGDGRGHELMGHKTIQMTLRYAHLALRLEAVQRLCDTGLALEMSTGM